MHTYISFLLISDREPVTHVISFYTSASHKTDTYRGSFATINIDACPEAVVYAARTVTLAL